MTRHSKHRLPDQQRHQKRKKSFIELNVLKSINIVTMRRIRLVMFYNLVLLLFVNEGAVWITLTFDV